MSEIKCQLVIPEVSNLTSQQITVGRHFLFQCQAEVSGEVPATFDFSKAQLMGVETNPYEFKLIKAQPDQSGFVLHMVSYTAGEIRTDKLQLTDGQNQIDVSLQMIKVDSVLDPQATVEKPQEPYGFIVSRLDWPWGYTVFFSVMFCAQLALIIIRSRARQKMRRLMTELKDYDSAMDADSQFYKNIRLFEKQNYPIESVEKQFRIYVIRKYQVPLFGLSLNQSLRFLKKRWPTLINERREIKNILMDLKKMSEKSNPEETKKYLTKLYKFVDQSEDKFRGLS